MGIQQFDGFKILTGINTYPGSGPLESHRHEIALFRKVLDNVTGDKPVMIEVGCHWALWSLMFRDRFRDGKNILVELGKRALLVGQKNFELNQWSCSSYFGGFFIDASGSYHNRAADLEYDNNENDHLVEHIPTIYTDRELTGPELNFAWIYGEEGLDQIDVVHMDIQGSEDYLIPYLLIFIPDRIRNFVIATHSQEIHDCVIHQLCTRGYEIIDNEGSGSFGKDGYIYARLEQP